MQIRQEDEVHVQQNSVYPSGISADDILHYKIKESNWKIIKYRMAAVAMCHVGLHQLDSRQLDRVNT